MKFGKNHLLAGKGAGFLWGRIPASAMKTRKPSVTTYPLIGRHLLNLERNPVYMIYVDKPSEANLMIVCRREILQERNAMNVKNVGKCLVILHPLGSMC